MYLRHFFMKQIVYSLIMKNCYLQPAIVETQNIFVFSQKLWWIFSLSRFFELLQNHDCLLWNWKFEENTYFARLFSSPCTLTGVSIQCKFAVINILQIKTQVRRNFQINSQACTVHTKHGLRDDILEFLLFYSNHTFLKATADHVQYHEACNLLLTADRVPWSL